MEMKDKIAILKTIIAQAKFLIAEAEGGWFKNPHRFRCHMDNTMAQCSRLWHVLRREEAAQCARKQEPLEAVNVRYVFDGIPHQIVFEKTGPNQLVMKRVPVLETEIAKAETKND